MNPHIWHSRPVCYHVRSLTSPVYACPPLYVALCLRGQCRLQYPSPLELIASLLMLTTTYTQAMALHIHTQGKFLNHTACSLYRIMVMAISVVGVMKIGNIMPRAGLKPTSLELRVSVLSLHQEGFPNVTAIPMPTCLQSSLSQRSVQTTTLSLF